MEQPPLRAKMPQEYETLATWLKKQLGDLAKKQCFTVSPGGRLAENVGFAFCLPSHWNELDAKPVAKDGNWKPLGLTYEPASWDFSPFSVFPSSRIGCHES